MKYRLFGGALLLSLSFRLSLTAATFYVAPDGNDSWSGSRPDTNGAKTDGPFATLPRALQQARTAGADRSRIELRGGNYFLKDPVIITPADSGVTLAAYKTEHPVLSGGRLLTGWKASTMNGRAVWEAPFTEALTGKSDFHELWVNGRRAISARHPHTGYLKVAELPEKTAEWTKGQQSFKYSQGDLPAFDGITNAEVVVMNRWVESHLPIAAVDDAQHLLKFKKRSVFQLAPGDVYYIEGALGALDQPGEWCLDRAAGKVYYLPTPEDKLDNIQAIAPVLSQVLRFEGEALKGVPGFVQAITISGLTFAHTEWNLPSGADKGRQPSLGEFAPSPEVGGFGQAAVGVPGAVWGQGVRSCRFERCRFINLGTYALELGRGCSRNNIVSCEFSDLGAGGIKLGEMKIVFNPDELAQANEVSDCTLSDGGKVYHSAIGIWIGQSPNNVLTHNEIRDFYYTGISIGWTWGYGPAMATNNFVAFNHVHHIGVKTNGDGPTLSDMAGIYTLGMQPGTRILNNLWHDIAGREYGGWGIYFDEGSCSIVARSNVVYRTTHGGFHQHYGATNFVENNIFAFARDQQLQRTRPEPHVSFSLTTNIVYFDHGTLLGSSWSDDKFKLDWNDYWDTRSGAAASNMKFGEASLEQWHARGHDEHSILEDPLFIDPARHNFSLQKGSPALKLGFHQIDLSQIGPRKKK